MPETISFGSGSFKNELWVSGKKVFTKPVGADVEFITSGAFEWIIADDNGVLVKTVRHDNAHGGWTSIDFPSLGLYHDYSIGFRNISGGEKKIKQGTVRLR